MDAALTHDKTAPVVPDGLRASLEVHADSFAGDTARIGYPTSVDPVALLTERRVSSRSQRDGRTSRGGATRMLRARDGWLAVSVARDDDVGLLAAWLRCDPGSLPGVYPIDDTGWAQLAAAVAQRDTAELDSRAGLLGLAVGVLPERPSPVVTGPPPFDELPIRATDHGQAPARHLTGTKVVDLSSLWAGPLCARLLARAGAAVTKIESTARPDGARRGDPAFFETMNADKGHVRIDLDRPSAIDALRARIMAADVVIEASRPRALAQLGIDAEALVVEGPQVWLSITARGRRGDNANRIGYGDDAAVAGGLVGWDDTGPTFCADAVADPCTGLVAACAVARALGHGDRWLIDVALTDVAAHHAGRLNCAQPSGRSGIPAIGPGDGVISPG